VPVDAGKLLNRIESAGIQLCIWRGEIVWPVGSPRCPATIRRAFEFSRPALARVLIRRIAEERGGDPHMWLLRLGDDPSSTDAPAPAYAACGGAEWCQRMVKQALLCEVAPMDRRWLVVGHKAVLGATTRDGVTRVTKVLLPNKWMKLGGPRGSRMQIVSACDDCIDLSQKALEKRRGGRGSS